MCSSRSTVMRQATTTFRWQSLEDLLCKFSISLTIVSSEFLTLQIEGVSFQGFNFRRIIPFNCIGRRRSTLFIRSILKWLLAVSPPKPTTPPTTTPAPTPLSQCQNGGVLVTNLDSSSYCYCLGLFTGTNCETRICANGGETSEIVEIASRWIWALNGHLFYNSSSFWKTNGINNSAPSS